MSRNEQTFHSPLARLVITRNLDGSLDSIQLKLASADVVGALRERSVRECHNHKTIRVNCQVVASSDVVVTTAINHLEAHPEMNVVHFVYAIFAMYQSQGMEAFDLVRLSVEQVLQMLEVPEEAMLPFRIAMNDIRQQYGFPG